MAMVNRNLAEFAKRVKTFVQKSGSGLTIDEITDMMVTEASYMDVSITDIKHFLKVVDPKSLGVDERDIEELTKQFVSKTKKTPATPSEELLDLENEIGSDDEEVSDELMESYANVGRSNHAKQFKRDTDKVFSQLNKMEDDDFFEM